MSTEDTSPSTSPSELTRLLVRVRAGDQEAAGAAMDLVYTELHEIARRYMARESKDHTLQATALVNEAYMRLLGPHRANIQDRQHFFALASQNMRRILVDHARNKKAKKRGEGAVKVELDIARDAVEQTGIDQVDVIQLHEALKELETFDTRAAKVVEFRYFGGHTEEEVAELLGEHPSTIRRDWTFAKSFLFSRISS